MARGRCRHPASIERFRLRKEVPLGDAGDDLIQSDRGCIQGEAPVEVARHGDELVGIDGGAGRESLGAQGAAHEGRQTDLPQASGQVIHPQ